jgi:hypothetical protein
MTRAQRVVRLIIQVLMPVGVLGAAGAIAGSIAMSFEQSRDVSTLLSPTREYGATLVSASQSCVQGRFARTSTLVYVERRWGFIKTGSFTPFCVENEPSHVQLAWQDDRTLRIECHGCDPDEYFVSDTNWGKLRFAYDLEGP